MNQLQHLPRFNPDTVRTAFLTRVTPTMTADEKVALNNEFQAALLIEEAKFQTVIQKIADQNAQVFLANPKETIEQLLKEAGRTFDLGEMLLLYDIATVTLKRYGKGNFIGKGTLGEGTISNFIATVTIGTHKQKIEVGSRNDNRSKDHAKAFAACIVAKELAQQKESA